MKDVFIGKGKLEGRGVYAKRAFKKGEVVITYQLTLLTPEEYKLLPRAEKNFTHVHWGKTYLYGLPERYVNHARHPNTLPDSHRRRDVAIRDIKKGEQITTDHTQDDVG